MKTKLLAPFATFSIFAMLLGLALNAFAPALFAIGVIATILSIAFSDYAPRPCYHRVMCTSQERFPFAA